MIWALLLLLLAALQWTITSVFRWRTWRDRGVLLALCTVALVPCLWTPPAKEIYEILQGFSRIPAGGILLPAVFFVVGLLGHNPFLFALFLGMVHPDHRLSMLVTLPLILGKIPQTLLLVFTMPPAQSGTERGWSGTR